MNRRTLFLLAILALSTSAFAERQWYLVKSPHFTVLCDVSEKEARRVAMSFEQMRAVFDHGNGMRTEGSAETIILAIRDEGALRRLMPEFWQVRGGVKPAGIFMHGWERDYALVNLEYTSANDWGVVYHEYIHKLIALNMRSVPLWMNEGLADFYAASRLDGDRAHVGSISGRLGHTRARPILPLKTLLTVNENSPYYQRDDLAGDFYASAWLLTHFLTFSEGMEGGKRFNAYSFKLQDGDDPVQAFIDTFGPLEKLDPQLELYSRRVMFNEYVMPLPVKLQEKDLPVRKLSPAEAEAWMASFQLRKHRRAEARSLLDDSLRQDDGLAFAHETMGFYHFDSGDDAAAVKEFDRAAALDPSLTLSAYYAAMLRYASSAQDREAQKAAAESLLKLVDRNGAFAPAYVALSRIFAQAGDLQNALKEARNAQQLERTRAGYYLNTARILEREGDIEEAYRQALFVFERYKGPDRDEATAILQRLHPAANIKNTFDPVLVPEKGIVRKITCGEKGALTIEIENESGTKQFHSDGATMLGYSDTLWYGSDHFNPCRRMEGMPAVLLIGPGRDGTPAAKVVEFREELPPAAKVAEAAKSQTAK